MKTRRFGANRIKAIDGGFRESAEVELYVVDDGNCAPTATPTLDSREVKILKRQH